MSSSKQKTIYLYQLPENLLKTSTGIKELQYIKSLFKQRLGTKYREGNITETLNDSKSNTVLVFSKALLAFF